MSQISARPVIVRPRRRRRIATGYPMNRSVTANTLKWAKSLPPGNSSFDSDQVFYQHTAYPAAGLAGPLTITQAAYSPGVNNWPQQGSFPANQSFVVDSIGFRLDPAVLIDGTVQGNGGSSQADADPVLLTQQIANIYQRSYATLYVNERPILIDQPLDTFPMGAGVSVSAALSNSNTSTANVISSVTNGVPVWGNRRLIRGRFPLAANVPWRIEVRQLAALPLNAASIAGGVLSLYMFGRWTRSV